MPPPIPTPSEPTFFSRSTIPYPIGLFASISQSKSCEKKAESAFPSLPVTSKWTTGCPMATSWNRLIRTLAVPHRPRRKSMDDDAIQARIDQLELEEQRLRKEEAASAEQGRTDVVSEDAGRLKAIKVELDQLWDLLRQRRALRSAGRTPDDAQMRDSETVERYLG